MKQKLVQASNSNLTLTCADRETNTWRFPFCSSQFNIEFKESGDWNATRNHSRVQPDERLQKEANSEVKRMFLIVGSSRFRTVYIRMRDTGNNDHALQDTSGSNEDPTCLCVTP